MLFATGIAHATQDPRHDPRLLEGQELLQRFEAGERELPVIVSLVRPEAMRTFGAWRVERAADQHRADVASGVQAVLDSLPSSEFTLGRRMENFPCFSGRLTESGLRRLLGNPMLESIVLDRTVEAHTDQGITLMNADGVRSVYTGSRLSIAIVDTGIDYGHPALGGGGFPNAKVIGGFDFGDDDPDPQDLQGHGTAVAGVAGGDVVPSGDYVGGVAHGARLYALKISPGDAGFAFNSTIIAAWDWCVTHQDDDPDHPILVINTSFGGGRNTSPCSSDPFEMAADVAASAGITLFVSAGNDGFCDAISAPACAPSVIAVGAVYDADIGSRAWCVQSASCVATPTGGCASGFFCADAATAADAVTCYSNSASFLGLLAPSNNATTPLRGGGYNPGFGGTSAASPYAAGAGALLIDAALSSGVQLSPLDVAAALIGTGVPIVDPKSAISKPRIDLERAVGLWVDFAYVGPEDGSISRPFNTLLEAVTAASAGSTINIKPGASNETLTVSKALRLRASGGLVEIGD